ncbi:MAG: Mrp/NBP35 family ATP-binding protein [Deltaproteobacteria bacterium]|nr:Mrp/NBP35 family ATP-binding protein [Candidatus Anaeroferrophillus wilburensis]MBN2889140.1 Mrp/NBP35 family ATP-binding protein [Deltaproteobacteria bacterium]
MADCADGASCSSCGSAGTCSPEEKQRREEEQLDARLLQIKHNIVVMSGKGGVGKSTVAVNLAVALAQRGLKVGLLDADIHGPNVPKMLGLEQHRLQATEQGIIPQEVMPGLAVVSMAFLLESVDNPIVWRGPLKHTVIRQFVADVQWGELDYLIVDLPPGTGDEPLSVAQILKKVDGSVIVTTPQDVALLDSRKSVTFSGHLKVPVIGIVENMSGFHCPHCDGKIDLFKRGGGELAASELKVPFLGGVPIDPQIVVNGDAGKPFIVAEPDSPAAKSFQQIADKCLAFIDKQ